MTSYDDWLAGLKKGARVSIRQAFAMKPTTTSSIVTAVSADGIRAKGFDGVFVDGDCRVGSEWYRLIAKV